MIIENKVIGAKTMTAEEFLKLDFNNLKEEHGRDVTKLKNAIVKSGFSFPVYVWAGNKFCIDGAGRKKAVKEMSEEGFEFSGIPYVEIEAKSLEEAMLKTLQASSQFGQITDDSFKIFTGGVRFDDDTFQLVGMEVAKIEDEINLDNIESNEDRSKTGKDIDITCPHCLETFNFKL